MILSAFSHSSFIHLGLNMYVLWTFAQVTVDKFLGPDQVRYSFIDFIR